ncbi:MAG: redox-regulated ATPase YchF [Proteobacteria bacterium]|nr:redox-regulated ATPase YchF [Pseudomonadota bacterium]
MSLRCGIVGLPNVGKSTLFNALTQSQVASENYAFCTIDPSTAHADIAEPRLEILAKIFDSAKIVPATLQITDVAGLVKGASKGEGLGNQFLGHIREVDALIHVVRCFDDDQVMHVSGGCDPLRDMETIDIEFILADCDTVEKHLEKKRKLAKTTSTKELKEYLQILEELCQHLVSLQTARSYFLAHRSKDRSEVIQKIFKDLHLLSAKKQLYVCNVEESYFNDPSHHTQAEAYIKEVSEYACSQGSSHLVLSAKIEAEISELESADDKKEMLASLGLDYSGLERLSAQAYLLLSLMHYFTAGAQETRAWTIPLGTRARDAAGMIHSDFAKGFIAAEVYKVSDLVTYKTKLALKEKGLLRIEGQDYVVEDDDVIEFRHHVSKAGKSQNF